jgi:polyphosphate kinase 2 PPK2
VRRLHIPHHLIPGRESPDPVRMDLGKPFFRGGWFLAPDPPVHCRSQKHRAPQPRRELSKVAVSRPRSVFLTSQHRLHRFVASAHSNTIKRWKLSPMDIQSRRRWVDYSRAKDEMFACTDTKKLPSFVNVDTKKRARLNCIAHLLRQVRHHDMTPVELDLPPRHLTEYKRPKMSSRRRARMWTSNVSRQIEDVSRKRLRKGPTHLKRREWRRG